MALRYVCFLLYTIELCYSNNGGYGQQMPNLMMQQPNYGGSYPNMAGFNPNYNPWLQNPGMQQQQQGSCPQPSSFGNNQQQMMNPMGSMFGAYPMGNNMGMGWQQAGGMPGNSMVNPNEAGEMNTMLGRRKRRAANAKSSSRDNDLKELVEILPDEPDIPQFPQMSGGGYQNNPFMPPQQQASPCLTNAHCSNQKICCPTAYGTKACMNPVTNSYYGQPNNNFGQLGYGQMNPMGNMFGNYPMGSNMGWQSQNPTSGMNQPMGGQQMFGQQGMMGMGGGNNNMMMNSGMGVGQGGQNNYQQF